jgi:hypothetical protein
MACPLRAGFFVAVRQRKQPPISKATDCADVLNEAWDGWK